MDRVKFRSGSAAEIGTAHHGFCFPREGESEEWIGVDWGLKPLDECGEDSTAQWPQFSLPKLIAVLKHHFFTHGHLDHVGGLPYLYKYYMEKGITEFWFYMSELALQTAEQLLWTPAYWRAKKEKKEPPFSLADIQNLKKHIRVVRPREVVDLGSCRVMAMHAGHIPGAFYYILVPKNGADPVLTSGDIAFRHVGRVPPAVPIPPKFKQFSLAVVESTYLGRDIPPRDEELARLRDFAHKVLDRGGTLVIPTFAIGLRDLEVGMYLESEGLGPVYYDGMVNAAIRLYKETGWVPASFDEKKLVRDKRETEMLAASHGPKIVIASGGMAQEGSRSWFYTRHSSELAGDGIAFIGFQGEKTPGKRLSESKPGNVVRMSNKESVRRVCDIERFQLSLHADGPELEAFIRRLNAKVVILNHGDSSTEIKAWIAANQIRFPGTRFICAEVGQEVGVP